MKQRKWGWMLALLLLSCGLWVAGCSKKKPAEQTPAPAATEQEAAHVHAEGEAAHEHPEGEAAKEPAAAAGEYTFEAFCQKTVDETKAAAGGSFPADAEKMTRDSCMKAQDAYKQSPKAGASMEAFVKTIMTACEGKSGKDWLECYGANAQKAGEAAMKAAM